nr:uncharacterized protein LOC111517180 [Leptinotarsa decemlineata]
MSEKKIKNLSQKFEISSRSSQKFPKSSSGRDFSQKSLDRERNDPSPASTAELPSRADPLSRYKVAPLPDAFPKLNDVKLPFVRDVGVKVAIEKLSDILGCRDYKLNAIQFWFLDIIADCLWRAQDEFQFPDLQQKIILEWVLYTFNLVRDERLDLSRKTVFKIIREAFSIAEDHIETGVPSLPLPTELFSLDLKERLSLTKKDNVSSSDSLGSSDSSEAGSFIAITFPEETKLFKLPKKPCPWISDEECLSSSIETPSEDEKPSPVDLESEEVAVEEEVRESIMGEEFDFYKPDMRTPPRFRPSVESLYETSSTSSEIIAESSEDESGDATWILSSSKLPRVPCPSKIFDIEHKSAARMEKQKEEEVLQALFDYHLWQLRKQDMADPRKGTTFSPDAASSRSFDGGDAEDKNDKVREMFRKYLKEQDKDSRGLRENIFINTCVLLAIKQFIFDYFYDTFHFFLLKTAFRNRHNLITQEVNKEWYIPKRFKGELKKPLPQKVKKPKLPKPQKPKKEKQPPKKEKKPKEEKKSKASKSTKKSTKSKTTDESKKSKATDKSKTSKSTDKSKASKSTDKSKKSKTPKKDEREKGKKVQMAQTAPMSKEEKEELARIERELKIQEEEGKKARENKQFMFPLTDAATDRFFQSIFEDWVRPKGKEKKEKKTKEEKKPKEGKSEKSAETEVDKSKKKGKDKVPKKGKDKKK